MRDTGEWRRNNRNSKNLCKERKSQMRSQLSLLDSNKIKVSMTQKLLDFSSLLYLYPSEMAS